MFIQVLMKELTHMLIHHVRLVILKMLLSMYLVIIEKEL